MRRNESPDWDFRLTKSEQRVVLIVMLALIAVALVRYERRIQHLQFRR